MHGDVAEESQRLRLVSPSWMGTGECEELFGECARVLDAAHEQQRLTQLSERARSSASMITTVAPGGHVFCRLREQGEGLCGAPTERIGHAQGRGNQGDPPRNVRVLAER